MDTWSLADGTALSDWGLSDQAFLTSVDLEPLLQNACGSDATCRQQQTALFNGNSQATVLTYDYDENGVLSDVTAADAVIFSGDPYGNNTRTVNEQNFSVVEGRPRLESSTSYSVTLNKNGSWSASSGVSASGEVTEQESPPPTITKPAATF